jgi:hypothetical protein
MTEAVLLLCEGRGHTDHFDVYQLRSVSDLLNLPESSSFHPSSAVEKWTGALVKGDVARQLLASLHEGGAFTELSDWGHVSLGAVTGNNGFFMLTPERANALGLGASELIRMSPAGSRHLRSIRYTASLHYQLGRQGAATLLFRPGASPSKAARSYIELGESMGVQDAYKCRVRSPWWQVPIVKTPDIFITCMNADTPRLAVNEARVRHLNSVHGLYLSEQHRPIQSALAVASLNSVTLLGAELVGRAYGGGILKLEPGEALHLPLPSLGLVALREKRLLELVPFLRTALKSGNLSGAVSEVDKVLFRRSRLLNEDELMEIRGAREHLAARRMTRSSSSARKRP